MDWMQITILTTTEASELISELLLAAGSEGTMIEDKNDIALNQRPEGRWDILDDSIAARMSDDVKVTGYYPIDERLSDTLANLRTELDRLSALELGFPLGKLEIVTEGFENQDWSECWKKSFKAIRLGEHIIVRPGWAECETQPGDKVIQIDPGMAFGTGTHETTGMCTALIEKYLKPGMTAIDIGTGTGILALVAAHMGARHVLATDLDATAVRVAAENIEINGFSDVIETRCGDLLEAVDAVGDIVIANIIADVSMMLAKPILPHISENGLYICSGVALERREEVRKALLDAGYTLIDEPVKGEWAAFAARKP